MRPLQFGRVLNWVAVVAVTGALVTAGLAVMFALLAASNERHLLEVRSREVASALTSSLPGVQTPLGAAVALADLTGADPARFARFAAPYVGRRGAFTSLSVWRIDRLGAGPVEVAGAPPALSAQPQRAAALLSAAAHSNLLQVSATLQSAHPRIDYAFTGRQPGPFVVEAEAALPSSRFQRLPPNSAFSNLNIAVYLSTHPAPANLLLKTVHRLPLGGPHARAVAAFGSTSLTVIAAARVPLGGSLPGLLPWIAALLGAALTAAASVLTFHLLSGRRRAQALAQENRRLYAEQRTIAQRLQHALLPDALPEVDGVTLAARYEAGDPTVEIGGDFYDVLCLPDGRLLLVVGDVTGKGIQAAAAMASLRYAIQFAAQTDAPEVFLPRLSQMRALREQHQLATVLCVLIDVPARWVSLTSAGHLPPLLLHPGGAEFLPLHVGPPIGVTPEAHYESTSVTLPVGATLLAFTDGLVERRRENLDVGLERLRSTALMTPADHLRGLVSGILEQVRPADARDDTAIAAIQWRNSN